MRPSETDKQSAFIECRSFSAMAQQREYQCLPQIFRPLLYRFSSHMQETVRLALFFQPRIRPDSVDYGQGETCQSGSSTEEEETRPLSDMRRLGDGEVSMAGRHALFDFSYRGSHRSFLALIMLKPSKKSGRHNQSCRINCRFNRTILQAWLERIW